jgi:23S rRNA pseudouridine2605 synthase
VITQPDEEQLAIWRRGVVMEDGSRTLPAKVEVMNNANNGTWLRIILKEGKKRQIRKVGSRIGLPVGKIKRVRIGTLKLGKLRSGEWRYLTDFEVKKLLEYSKPEKEKIAKKS